MKPSRFAYHTPKTINEAVAILADVGTHGAVLAGGQILVPMMAFRVAAPEHLVDINGVEELRQLGVVGNALEIGACVRHAAFQKPVVDGPLGGLLAAVVRYIAHYPIRTRGTFCGSLANADPASEWCLVAATLGATMTAASTRGLREIAASAFFQGVMTTALAEDELLVKVRLPLLAADTRWGFYEFNRRAGDFAVAMALATFRIAQGVIVDPRVGVGGVEAHARADHQAEAALAGKPPERCRLRGGGRTDSHRPLGRSTQVRRSSTTSARSSAPQSGAHWRQQRSGR